MATKLVKKVVDGQIVEVEEEVPDEEESDSDNLDLDDDDSGNDDDRDDDDSSDSGDDDPQLWMSNEDDQQSSDSMPVSTHIRVKQKLKGRLSKKDEELEALRAENATLKAGLQKPKSKALKRPQEDDYDTQAEYNDALSKYESDLADQRLADAEQRRELQNRQNEARRNLETAVDSHYERAAKLITDNKIDPEVYQKTDLAIRESVETIIPGKGDLVVDQVISMMGEGSEKVLFFIGRNKKALETFKTLLKEDSSGLKASIFLGQQKERLLNSRRKTSRARPPGKDANGDNNSRVLSGKANALLKKRKAALNKGDVQLAYDIKKEARAQGVDVSNW